MLEIRREALAFLRVRRARASLDRQTRLVDPGLKFGLIGGLELQEIVLAEYDPTWAERFVVERDRIASALGPVARMIEHVGSTAVPGLAAKPIVDIQVTVDDPEQEDAYLPVLEGAGYVLRVREADHRMFRTPERDVHVHIWKANSEDEERHLVFRDYLRTNAKARDDYEQLKRELAPKFQDTNDYAQAKNDFIKEAVLRARAERTSREE